MAARRFESDPTLLTRLARSVTSSTADVSYMWTGTMMQISIQMGLNRPMNPQDFTKFRIKLNDKEIAERVRTWAACNIVAQRYDIGYLLF